MYQSNNKQQIVIEGEANFAILFLCTFTDHQRLYLVIVFYNWVASYGSTFISPHLVLQEFNSSSREHPRAKEHAAYLSNP